MPTTRGATRAEYSIAAVSKLTGVSCHALRVWERRYGFPEPLRSASGHRRYGADQVRMLRRVAELVRAGHPIGELIEKVQAGSIRIEDEPSPGIVAEAGSPSAELVGHLLAGDIGAADAQFERMALGLSPTEVVTRLIEPALVDLGERWFRRECEIFHEHCASGFFRRKLDGLLELVVRANPRPARTALVGTVQGDRHHGGVLMFSLMLELSGWRALELGVDLPVREYQRAIEAWRPDAVALSFVLSRNINKRFGELTQIRGVPVFVGGRSILNYQGLARRNGLIPVVGSVGTATRVFLAEFDQWTRRNRPAGAAIPAS